MARVAGDRLNDVRESIALYNQVLAIAERDADALTGLATLYDRERRWPALIEMLERQRLNAAAQNHVAGELALLERRGTLLYERLGATQAAIEVFRRIQELQPKNARAARALREIYAQSGDYAALEALYAEHGAFGDLCDQLTSLADRTADMAARTRLLERVAALIAQEKLNQPERALKAYERILATDPRNRGAALALLPLYRARAEVAAPAGDLRGAAGARGAARRHQRWPTSCELLAEARKICEQRLGSKALAFQWCARAFEAAPKNEAVRTDLERLAGEADEWGNLATLYDARTAATTDAEERLWLLRRTLRIASTRLFRPLDARKAAEQILTEIGFDEEADAALEQILTQTKAWADLAKLLHARADRAPDAAERVRLLFRIAQLEEERVGDAAAAAATWKKILEAEPTNERALRALVRLSEARQDWAGVVEGLRRDLASRPADSRDEREALLLRIANIQEVRLDDPEATFASYREVLQANPHAAPAVAGLERLLAGGYADRRGDRAADAAVLRADRRRAPSWRARQRGAAGGRRHARREGRAAGEAARALRRAGQRSGGRLPRRPGAVRHRSGRREEPRRAARVRGRAPARPASWPRSCAPSRPRPRIRLLRRDLLVVVAELQEKRLGRAQDAEKVYAQILAAEPLHAGAFRALSRLYRDGQRWAELRALLDTRQLAELDVRERLELLAQIAELDESALDDQDHALAVYEKMLELDAADLRAHRALDRHYAARERWRDLENLLGTRVGFASEAEVPELEFRRAELRASHLEDVAGALDLLEQIVKVGAQPRGRAPLLEKLVAMPEQRQRVAKILEPVYEASGAWARLVGDPRRRARGRWRAATAAALLARIADLQENKLQARGAALATWRQVLAADPGNPDALARDRAPRHGAGALLRAGRRLSGAGVQEATRPTSRGAPTCCRGPPSCTRGAWATGARPSTSGSWFSPSIPRTPTRRRPPPPRWRQLYTETGDVAGLVKILAMQVRWAPSADGPQEDPVPHRRAAGEVAERRRRRGRDAALDPGDRSAGAGGDRRASITSSRRARSTGSGSR